MIHLFKKVYITSDKVISLDFDRVVISETNGVKVADELARVTQGALLGFGTSTKDMTFKSVLGMLQELSDHVDETGKRAIIYADDAAFLKILCTWYKFILANPSKGAIIDLITSSVFKMNSVFQGRFSSSTGETGATELVDLTDLESVYDSTKPNKDTRDDFVAAHKASLSAELLLASYLNDGSHKEELKSVLKPLLMKDLEKFMFEMKEVFFYHVTNKSFADKLGLDTTYTLSNIHTIVDDKSKFASLFMDPTVWNTKYLSIASSGSNVNFDAMTDDHITDLKEFITLASSSWNELNIYDAADKSKLNYIPAITGDFTDAELEDIILMEASYDSVTGSFFSNEHETVNHYLIQAILDNKDNTTFLSKYAV